MGRHWQLINDGDLWAQAFTVLKNRGPASVLITKVKGHAKEKDVVESSLLQEYKRGNDTADLEANKGLKSNGDGKLEFGKYLFQL